MTTVIHHSADFDGEFCREIAKKFLPTCFCIGWDFGDPPIPFPPEGTVYVMDLPFLRQLFSTPVDRDRLVWIDHHKSSIDEVSAARAWPACSYCIDGVAACRLAWQWFNSPHKIIGGYSTVPDKEEYLNRKVIEPLAVRLAGEYDVWDHRDDKQDIAFQYGLRAQACIDWHQLLSTSPDNRESWSNPLVRQYIDQGWLVKRYHDKTQQEVGKKFGFDVQFEGLRFIALNTQARNSFAIDFMATPEHDGLITFSYTGKDWRVSMYQNQKNDKDIDLSVIAKKYGGGGHKGACGFMCRQLPWLPLYMHA